MNPPDNPPVTAIYSVYWLDEHCIVHVSMLENRDISIRISPLFLSPLCCGRAMRFDIQTTSVYTGSH